MKPAISHILLDIEGTTCPVSFVSGTLFPYATRELGPFLERHQRDSRIQELVEMVERDWQQDPEPEAQHMWRSTEQAIQGQRATADQELKDDDANKTEGVDIPKHQRIVPYLQWLISVDRKYTPLKELQGMVWQEGYARGELKSTLFAEVPETLQRWHEQGLVLGVYSSGSVAAQKLLYGHSQAGDLRALFCHWFDTHVGGKHEAESYRRICEAMQVKPEQVLFISDSHAELQAAQEAQLQVILSERECNPSAAKTAELSKLAISTAANSRLVHSLDQVDLSLSSQ